MNTAGEDLRLSIADAWQRNFPLSPRPFAEIGQQAGVAEAAVILAFRELAAKQMLSRVGAVVRPNCAGSSTLAAMAVAPDRVADAAAAISLEPFVNHNYERDHVINLWFVVTAPNDQELTGTLRRLRDATGCDVHDLRLVEPYHIDLGFGLTSGRASAVRGGYASRPATERERMLLGIIEDGLPLVPAPYEAVAAMLGWQEYEVTSIISAMIAAGIISRFGCVLRHRELGYTANAMAVWDAADDQVADAGRRLARHADVTLCYRRKRVPPHWNYNLFAMVHGRDELLVRDIISELTETSGLSGVARDILFSRRCFLQRGARFRGRRELVAA